MMKINLEDYSTSENIPKKPSFLLPQICFMSMWRCLAIISTIFVITLTAFVFKTYIKVVLFWLEAQNRTTVSIALLLLYLLVSVPICVGYILLVVASGYLFGVYSGLGLTILGANLGALFAHNFLRYLTCYPIVYKITETQVAQAVKRVILGPSCFKIVMFSRLTPIPYGLQNTIFSLTNINRRVYHMASFVGLLPAQFIGVYFGSTVRSMKDVLEHDSISSATYCAIIFQLLLGAFLLLWIGSKARHELIKALAEAENTGPKIGFTMV